MTDPITYKADIVFVAGIPFPVDKIRATPRYRVSDIDELVRYDFDITPALPAWASSEPVTLMEDRGDGQVLAHHWPNVTHQGGMMIASYGPFDASLLPFPLDDPDSANAIYLRWHMVLDAQRTVAV